MSKGLGIIIIIIIIVNQSPNQYNTESKNSTHIVGCMEQNALCRANA